MAEPDKSSVQRHPPAPTKSNTNISLLEGISRHRTSIALTKENIEYLLLPHSQKILQWLRECWVQSVTFPHLCEKITGHSM